MMQAIKMLSLFCLTVNQEETHLNHCKVSVNDCDIHHYGRPFCSPQNLHITIVC